MSEERASLTRNGHGQDVTLQTRMFTTLTPPRITPKTRIVAATHPTAQRAAHDDDGWFVADFFAFNYLFHGLGQSQTWLAPASPQAYLAKNGQYVHGNPFRDRKVVLSDNLLRENKLSPVTVVRHQDMVDRFLKETKATTEAAKRDGGAVMLLIFCHGIDKETLALDYCRQGNKLTITMLRGVLEPYVPVCLLTTACYSGGWSVCNELNITTLTAAAPSELSLSWPESRSIGRLSGSVFAGAVIDALAASVTTSDNTPARPAIRTPEQVATFNSFCSSIWHSCQGLHRLWREQTFSFSAQDDKWDEPFPRMAAIDLADYRDRWNQLVTYSYTGSAADKANLDPSPLNPNFEGTAHATATGSAEGGMQHSSSRTDVNDVDDWFVGPFLDSLRNNRIEPMVRLWRRTCPGDELGGYGPMLHGGFMTRCVRTNSLTPYQNEEDADEEDPNFFWNLNSVLQYRWNMAMLAQDILASLGLAPPGNANCLFWNRKAWERETQRVFGVTESDFKDRNMAIWLVFNQKRSSQEENLIGMIEPAPEQGPTFYRFIFYIMAGIVESLYRTPAGDSDIEIQNRIESLGQAVFDRVQQSIDFYTRIALADPEVHKRKQDWIRTMRQ